MTGDTVPAGAPPSITIAAGEPRPLDSASRGRLLAVLVTLTLFAEVVPFQYTLGGTITQLVGRSFPSSGNAVTWMVTIIGVVGAGTMALVTRMADLWGPRRMLLSCGVAFLAGSVVCAVTTSWTVFLVGRGLEALALGMSPLCYTLIRDIMPRRWIPISVGVIGTGLGMSAVLGSVFAGVLTDHYTWRSTFWFLAAYMVVTIPLLRLFVPDSPRRERVRLDVAGAVLLGLGLAGILVYASEGQDWGWGRPSCYGYLIGGVLALVLFVVCEIRVADPIIDLRLLRNARMLLIVLAYILGTMVITVASFVAAYMFLIDAKVVQNGVIGAAAAKTHLPAPMLAKLLTFHGDLSYAHGYSVTELAFRVILWSSVTAMIFALIGGLWARRSGPRVVLVTSMVLLLVATVGLAAWHDTWQAQAVYGVVFGIGFGFFYAGMPNLIIETVTPDQQAVSSGIAASFGAIGSAVATALATAVLVHHPFQVIAPGPTGQKIVNNIPQVYTNGGFGQVYLLVGGGGAALGLLVALALFFARRKAAE